MAHPLRIQRKRTKGYRLPAGAVCVHRPTKWGNPFKVVDENRCERTYNVGHIGKVEFPMNAVDAFDDWLHQTEPGLAILALAREELRGKQLACFCPLNRRCHADVLAEIANEGVK